MTTIHLSASEAIAECNQLLRADDESLAADQPTAKAWCLTRRQRAAIAKLISLALPEALGQRRPDPQRRHT